MASRKKGWASSCVSPVSLISGVPGEPCFRNMVEFNICVMTLKAA